MCLPVYEIKKVCLVPKVVYVMDLAYPWVNKFFLDGQGRDNLCHIIRATFELAMCINIHVQIK